MNDFCLIHGYTLRYDRRSGFHLCQKCEEIMEGWMPLPETEPPAGPVLLVVIARTVQHMPALWDGTEWTWLNADDADDPIPTDKITHWRHLPKFP
jgi:hypothetical protein